MASSAIPMATVAAKPAIARRLAFPRRDASAYRKRCRKRTAAYDATKTAASLWKASGSDTPARNIITSATSRTTRKRRASSSSALAAHTNADQAHHTSASNNNERPTDGQVRSRLIVVDTCVTAKTNTRSHSSSRELVRRSTGQEPSASEPASRRMRRFAATVCDRKTLKQAHAPSKTAKVSATGQSGPLSGAPDAFQAIAPTK